MRPAPLLWAAAAFAAGLLAGPSLMPGRMAVLIAACFAGVAIAVWYGLRRRFSLAAGVIGLFLLGAIWAPPPLPETTAARVTAIRGWLDGEERIQADQIQSGLRLTAWRLGNGTWQRPDRRLHLWISNLPGGGGYGRRLEARGRLSTGKLPGSDGYFRSKTLRYLPGSSGNPIQRTGLALRRLVTRTYASFMSSEEQALLSGLVFGDLPALPPRTVGWFRDTGALHLLSVSGLHVGFLMAMIMALAGLAGWRGWRAYVPAALAVLGYIVLCGAKPPILRAAVMLLAAGAGMLGRRRMVPANALGLAGLAVLFYQPWAVWTISFQLSFAASAGLAFLYPRWVVWCPERLAIVGKPLLVSIAASLAVLPLQLSAFGRVSLIGPLANLVLVPLAGVIMQLGLAAGLLGAILPWLAGPILTGVGVLLDLLLLLARVGASLPGAAFNLGGWTWMAVIGYYVLLGMVGFGLERNPLNRRARSLGIVVLALAVALAAGIWWQVLAEPAGLSVTFLDVGQGDSVLIRAPGGRTALMDGGEEGAAPRILAYLRQRGINRLDLMILTHPHSDHVGGLSSIVEEMAVGQVLDPGWTHPSAVYRRFLLALKARKVPWTRARSGLTFTLGSAVKGVVLYPIPGAAEPEEMNDGSLVIKISYGRQSVLLTGDLGFPGEEELLTAGKDLRATVLKVAHHGSATSTSKEWLAAVHPQIAVISVGRGNRYGHPRPETLARLRAAKVKIYRTDLQGNITWSTDGKKSKIAAGR